jgi:Fic family protein
LDIADFKAGVMRRINSYSYFLPEKINHPFSWTDTSINELLEMAALQLGGLNSFSRFVPDTDMFIRMHVYKEAVTSSRIEGTRTNMNEALVEKKNIDPEKRDDWQEVNNYVTAMNRAIIELKRLPLSNRLIKNTHQILLSSGRGQTKNPGEFRVSQNWIGGASLADAVYIPPAPAELPELLGDFELFLHNTEIQLPHLIRIALAHYQFESIHPFLDGNGRVGRLLITLYLVSSGLLGKPLLYLSAFFEKNKSTYYDNLTAVRTGNDLGRWIKFFLTGVIQTADAAEATLKKIVELKESTEGHKIKTLGKREEQGEALLRGLFSKPIVAVADIQKFTGLSPKSANSLVSSFIELGILKETTGFQRNRVFVFEKYMKLFA